jgi:hypothetical protein
MWISEVADCTKEMFIIEYLCVLFVGDGVCLGVLFDNLQDWKEIREKAREIMV